MCTQPRRSRKKRSGPAAGLIVTCLALAIALVVLPGCAQDQPGNGKPGPNAGPAPQTAPNREVVSKPVKRKAEELRKKYPYESLAGRLEYETNQVAQLAKEGRTSPLTKSADQRLTKFEATFSSIQLGNVRSQSLQLLHSDQVEDFITRDGMGVSRMMLPPSPRYLELPDTSPIALPEAGSTSVDEEVGDPIVLPQKYPQPPVQESWLPSVDLLAGFHDGGLFNFLNPSGFGHVKDLDHVAGFRSHQFRAMPALWRPPVPGKVVQEKERWVVRRLELVSLLKHDEPAVYVSESLPRMDALQKAVTRPLSDFESRALKALQGGEDLVTRATTEQIRMLGSVRAGKQCLSCHGVQRGELLGAFSYKLQRRLGKEAGK